MASANFVKEKTIETDLIQRVNFGTPRFGRVPTNPKMAQCITIDFRAIICKITEKKKKEKIEDHRDGRIPINVTT